MELLYTLFLMPIEFLMRLILNAAYALTNNYGLAIILLSLVINILLIPVYNLAEKWRAKDKLIRDSMADTLADIKANYSGKERYFYTQTTYRVNNYSPFSSVKASMGFLIQIPFFFAAFHFLSNYQPLEGVSFAFLSDLSQADGLLGGINLLPFIMTLTNLAAAYYYLQNASKNEKYQIWGMAGLFLVLLYTQASALLLYWTMNNVFALVRAVLERKVTLKLPDFISRFSLQKTAEKIYPTGKWVNYLIVGLYLVGIGFLYASLDGFNLMKVRAGDYSIYLMIVFLFTFILSSFLQTIKHTSYIRASNLYLIISSLVLLISSSYFAFYVSKLQLNGSHPKVLIFTVIILIAHLFLSVVYNTNLVRGLWLEKNKLKYTDVLLPTLVFLLLMLVVNPMFLFSLDTGFVISKEQLFKLSWLTFLITSIVFSFLILLLNENEKRFIFALVLFLLTTSTAYSFLIRVDFGVLDRFVFVDPSKLNIDVKYILLEILILIALMFLLVRHFNKLILVSKYISSILLVVFIAFILKSQVFDSENKELNRELVSSNNEVEENLIFSMSKEKNVLVFFFDAFAGGHVQKMIDDNPEIFDGYDGFTWYKNALSSSNPTAPTHSAMAGGHDFTLHTLSRKDYTDVLSVMDEAYKVFPRNFKQNGWELDYRNLSLLPSEYLDKDINNFQQDFGLKYLSEKSGVKGNSAESSVSKLEFVLFNFVSTFNAAPFFLKSTIYNNGDWLYLKRMIENNLFDQDIFIKAREWGLLNFFVDNVDFKRESKVLKYYRFMLPHHPHSITMKGELKSGNSSYYIESFKTIELLPELFNKIQEAGYYDNTKIILVSDHGTGEENANLGYLGTDSQNIKLRNGSGYPLLMVKDFNQRGNFKVSDTLVSNADLAAIVCSANETGCDIPDLDPTKNDLDRDLFISEFSYKGYALKKKFIIGDIYKVKDNIFDPDNWTKVFDGETQKFLED